MGRPKIDIILPSTPFTTGDLKAQNPHVSAFVIQRNLEDWIAWKRVHRIGSQPNATGGKAFYVYAALPPTPNGLS